MQSIPTPSRVHLIGKDETNDENVLYWSEDGNSWDPNNRFVLPYKSLRVPSLTGFPSIQTPPLPMTYIRDRDHGQVYGSTSRDWDNSWSPEFTVTGVRSRYPPNYSS